MMEYANATKTLHFAQQVQTLQQQVPGFMAATAQAAESVEKSKKPDGEACTTQYVHEKIDGRLQQQWSDDDRKVDMYKAVQREQDEPLEVKKDTQKHESYPKAKAMPIKLEHVGTMEVATGTLELFARLIPKKKDVDVAGSGKGEAKASSGSVTESKAPTPPSCPPPHLRHICAPPPPVPVWKEQDGETRLGSVSIDLG